MFVLLTASAVAGVVASWFLCHRANILPWGVKIETALREPEEQIYIRLEDLIIIHEDHAEIISDFVPMDIDAIEAWMAQDGLLQDYPDMEVFLGPK